MKVSKDKLIWTFKRARVQFRGNYDIVVEDIVKSSMKWLFFLGVWKLIDLAIIGYKMAQRWIG